MKIKEIDVVIKEVGKPAYRERIPNTLEALQDIVCGCIETVTIASDCVLICNEEGRINGQRFNCRVGNMQFFGPIIFAGRYRDQFADLKNFDAFRNLFPGLFESEEDDLPFC